MVLTKLADEPWILSDECTLAELGEWIRHAVDDSPTIWKLAVEEPETRSNIVGLIEDAEAQQSLGMEWTHERVAVLLMLADAVQKKHGWSDREVDAFVKTTLCMLAGYPEPLQSAIDINMKKAALRMSDRMKVTIHESEGVVCIEPNNA